MLGYDATHMSAPPDMRLLSAVFVCDPALQYWGGITGGRQVITPGQPSRSLKSIINTRLGAFQYVLPVCQDTSRGFCIFGETVRRSWTGFKQYKYRTRHTVGCSKVLK